MSHITKLKPIEVSADDYATIELDMDLKDPNSKIFLYKVRDWSAYLTVILVV